MKTREKLFLALVATVAAICGTLGVSAPVYAATGCPQVSDNLLRDDLLHGNDWVQAQAYGCLINKALVSNGKPMVPWQYYANKTDVTSAMLKNEATMVVSVERTKQLLTDNQETGARSLFKPAFEMARGASVYEASISYPSDVWSPMRQACYGWYGVQAYSSLVGVNTQPNDRTAINAWIDQMLGVGSSTSLASAYTVGIAAQSLSACDALASTK